MPNGIEKVIGAVVVAGAAVGTVATIGGAIGCALDGLVGSLVLSNIGYGAIATAAGTLGSVTLACAVGGVIVSIPAVIASIVLMLNEERLNPFIYEALTVLLNLSWAVCAGFIGATLMGLATTPVAACALAGAILLNIFPIISVVAQLAGALIGGTILGLAYAFDGIISGVEALARSVHEMGSESNAPSAPPMDPESNAPSAPLWSAFFQDAAVAIPVETDSFAYPMANAKLA